MANSENIVSAHNHLAQYAQYTSYGQMIDVHLNRLNGDDVCMIDASTDEHLTVSELKSRANGIAVALIERGINKTDKIIFYGKNSIQHLVLRFATYLLGNTYIPLSVTYGKYEIEREVNNTGANIIFTTAEDVVEFGGLLNDNEKRVKLLVIFDGKHDKYVTYEQLLDEGRVQTLEKIPYFDVNREDIALLIPTSGTTGDPTLAMISNRYLINASIALADIYPLPVATRLIHGAVIPLTHISGAVIIVSDVMNGATVVTVRRLTDELLLRAIEKYRINVLTNFGKAFSEELLETYDLSSLKYVKDTNRRHMKASVVHKYGIKFFTSYNMTEYMPVTQLSGLDGPSIQGSAGRISQSTEAKVVDLTTGACLGAGIDGEICIRGDKLFSGYFNNPGAMEEALDGEGWYRTGDIGHYDDEKRLFITGRKKELMTVFVDNTLKHISPIEIVGFLLKHKSIADAIVVGVRDGNGFQRPRAFVVLKDGHTLKEEDIERYVSDTLPVAKHLTGGVVFVDVIHTLASGKPDQNYYKNLVKNEIIE